MVKRSTIHRPPQTKSRKLVMKNAVPPRPRKPRVPRLSGNRSVGNNAKKNKRNRGYESQVKKKRTEGHKTELPWANLHNKERHRIKLIRGEGIWGDFHLFGSCTYKRCWEGFIVTPITIAIKRPEKELIWNKLIERATKWSKAKGIKKIRSAARVDDKREGAITRWEWSR